MCILEDEEAEGWKGETWGYERVEAGGFSERGERWEDPKEEEEEKEAVEPNTA